MASAQLCVQQVLADTLECPRLLLTEIADRDLTQAERDAVTKSVARLVAGEPLQYVLGNVNFYGYHLVVNRDVLIPRPETEELVSRALALPIWQGGSSVDVVDVGTGSGCVAIAIAAMRAEAHVLALDASREALALARGNIDAHELADRVRLGHGNLLADLNAATMDLVISNPPYVTESEYLDLDPGVRDFEPRDALVAGGDGLAIYRRLLPEARCVLRSGGWILLEIGANQRLAVESLLKKSGFIDIVGFPDVNGLDRMVQARCP